MNLFVYGTLRPGGTLHDGWLGGRPSAQGTTSGALFSLPGWPAPGPYPLADFTESVGQVVGDVFSFDDGDSVLAALHRMETSVGYRLASVVVEHSDGTRTAAVAYQWDHKVGERIDGGDWLEATCQR